MSESVISGKLRIPNDFGLRARGWLREAGKNQADFVRELGVKQTRANSWFRGRTLPEVDILPDFARVIEKPLEVVVGDHIRRRFSELTITLQKTAQSENQPGEAPFDWGNLNHALSLEYAAKALPPGLGPLSQIRIYGDLFRRWRKEIGFDQTEAAEYLGFRRAHAAVGGYENEREFPSKANEAIMSRELTSHFNLEPSDVAGAKMASMILKKYALEGAALEEGFRQIVQALPNEGILQGNFFAKLIDRLLEVREIKQAQLARELEIYPGNLTDYRTRDRLPALEGYNKLAQQMEEHLQLRPEQIRGAFIASEIVSDHAKEGEVFFTALDLMLSTIHYQGGQPRSMAIFSGLVDALQRKLGMTRDELAVRVKIAPSTLSHTRHANDLADETTFLHYANAMLIELPGITPEQIVGGYFADRVLLDYRQIMGTDSMQRALFEGAKTIQQASTVPTEISVHQTSGNPNLLGRKFQQLMEQGRKSEAETASALHLKPKTLAALLKGKLPFWQLFEQSPDFLTKAGRFFQYDERQLVHFLLVDLACYYERGEKRTPTYAAQELEGCHVVSANGTGDSRYIVVSGIMSNWPVTISARQWEAAKTHGHNYYLYLVYDHLTSKPNLLDIQDPANKLPFKRWSNGQYAVKGEVIEELFGGT